MKATTLRTLGTMQGILLAGLVSSVSAKDKLDRTSLPIQEPKRPTYSELDVRNVEAPPFFEVKAPKGAPNVVIVLIDDVGFGATSTFGGRLRLPLSHGAHVQSAYWHRPWF